MGQVFDWLMQFRICIPGRASVLTRMDEAGISMCPPNTVCSVCTRYKHTLLTDSTGGTAQELWLRVGAVMTYTGTYFCSMASD